MQRDGLFLNSSKTIAHLDTNLGLTWHKLRTNLGLTWHKLGTNLWLSIRFIIQLLKTRLSVPVYVKAVDYFLIGKD